MVMLPRAVLLTYAVLALATALVAWESFGEPTPVLLGVGFLSAELAAVGWSVRAATLRRLAPSARRPWRFLAAAFLMHIAYGALIGATVSEGDLEPGVDTLLVAAVVVRILQIPVMLAGLLAFAGEPMSSWQRRKLALDVTTVVGMAVMVIWYWLIGPGVFGGDTLSDVDKLLVTLFPLCDLVLATGLVAVLLRGIVATARRSVILLLSGITGSLVADSVLTYRTVFQDGGATLLTNLLAIGPVTLMAAAAVERCRSAVDRADAPAARRIRPYTALPYLALAAGYSLLFVVALKAGSFPWPGLVLGAMVMTGAVAGRQLVSLQENHQLAVTDTLTGLANRRLLRERMLQADERSQRSGAPNALLLFDLDGFKQINDTRGHEAGDAILVAFSEMLRRQTRAVDTQARLGGDEFAVLLAGVGGLDDAVEAAERLLRELRAGPLVAPDLSVGCSIGIVLTEPGEHADPHQLLRRADHAMYIAKRAGADGWHVFTEEPAGDPEVPKPRDTRRPSPL